MILKSYTLEIITPCFCGGARPKEEAEIRAPSIRGQLRWWFRVLGGFKALSGMSLRAQEALIFGSTAGDESKAGKLIVRTRPLKVRSSRKDAPDLGHKAVPDAAYLTFPIQPTKNGVDVKRGSLDPTSRFEVSLLWSGDASLVPSLHALMAVFAHFGSLGFRSRRAMGALAPVSPSLPCSGWQDFFQKPTAIVIRCMAAANAENAVSKLGGWLRQWRSYGRGNDHGKNKDDKSKPPPNCGSSFATRDHDIGYGLIQNQPAYRPALGLPIIQRVGSRIRSWDYEKKQHGAKSGRFASPVLLRPHRDAQNKWHALVIFVDARQWPEGKKAYIDGREQSVSRDLYVAMKEDKEGFLQSFP